MRYDPDVAPDPESWLALDESIRQELARKAHDPAPDWHPKATAKHAHVIYHVMVENQVAANDPPEVAAALARLTEEGLDRHDALHAVANILAEETWSMLKEKRSFDTDAYQARLEKLKASDWRR